MDREGIVSQRPRRERCHVAVAATVTPRIFGLRHMPRESESHTQPRERTSGTQGTSHVGECVVVVSVWCADHALCQPSTAKCPLYLIAQIVIKVWSLSTSAARESLRGEPTRCCPAVQTR